LSRHIFYYGLEMGALWELSGSSLGALWELSGSLSQLRVFSKKRKQEDEDAGIEYYWSNPCITLEKHLLKRDFHYLTIFMDRTK
jgi:hypothetical protein